MGKKHKKKWLCFIHVMASFTYSYITQVNPFFCNECYVISDCLLVLMDRSILIEECEALQSDVQLLQVRFPFVICQSFVLSVICVIFIRPGASGW